jgi:DNA polymerase elongation subunit (family B)
MLRTTIQRLYAGSIPLDQIGLTKTIRAKYKNENLPQARVAEQMRQRGETVRSNDRVTYVVLVDQNKVGARKKSGKIGDRVDDINYVQKHKCELDYNYYIDNQLYQPLEQLLGLVTSENEFARVVDEEKRQAAQKRSSIAKRAFVTNMFGPKKKQRVD